MARRSATGDFLMLLVLAAIAGAFLGDWAFKAAIALGIIVMLVATVGGILSSWGIDVRGTAPVPVRKRPADPPPRLPRLVDSRVEDLLYAVNAGDNGSIERYVLRENLSPFENGEWQGRRVSAAALARELGNDEAGRFFSEWSRVGSAARLIAGSPQQT